MSLHVNTKSSPTYRKNDRKVLLITVRSTTLDAFYCDFLYSPIGVRACPDAIGYEFRQRLLSILDPLLLILVHEKGNEKLNEINHCLLFIS